MNRYTKIIGLTGTIYVKEFVKIKHHKNKVRDINEDTVAKVFKNGDAEVTVYFEETDTEIFIDAFTDQETIKKYLGKKFI
ncbi:MAG TPA: hypothetical protein DCS67_00665 [Clostridiales bacterium UBA8960]|nr:hypothetical protein [Clostridiales bacterium UBA8960]